MHEQTALYGADRLNSQSKRLGHRKIAAAISAFSFGLI